jgi:transcriptional regulator with XRE-family HTH domain
MEASRHPEPHLPAGAARPSPDQSPLARARLHRQLTVEEAARRAGIPVDELRWLEEGRVYRFPDPDSAMLAAVLVASALGIRHREALELAGLPVPPRPLAENGWRRLAAVGGIGAAVLALTLAVVLARSTPRDTTPPKPSIAASAAKTLPPPWAVKVVVLNGSGDIVYTRTVASKIQALSYRVVDVGKAGSFNYPQTQVYYPPGGQAIGLRLAKQLDAPLAPLPGGSDPRRLVVIVGPERGPGE